MLTIRLNRVGKRNKPYFRVVLQERVIAPGGKHIEILGSWDPYLKKAILKAERIKYWISKGAQASDTAYNLFIKEGIIKGEKRAVKIPKKAESEKPVEPASVKTMAVEGSQAAENKNEKVADKEVKKEKSEEKNTENPEEKSKEEVVVDKK